MATKKNTIVISGFPGIGKTKLYTDGIGDNDTIILDSDSSKFSWLDHDRNMRNPDFPNNYINHIKDNIGVVDIIFVSSHENVRNAMRDAGIDYVLVYPERNLRIEYIWRFVDRRSPSSFVNFMDANWKSMIDSCVHDAHGFKIEIGTKEYLSDYIDSIREIYNSEG